MNPETLENTPDGPRVRRPIPEDDKRDGAVGGWSMLRPPPGRCEMCNWEHDAAHPHNRQTLFYQTRFHMIRGRPPTWEDAMEHCTPELRRSWRTHLANFLHAQATKFEADREYGKAAAMCHHGMELMTSDADRVLWACRAYDNWLASGNRPMAENAILLLGPGDSSHRVLSVAVVCTALQAIQAGTEPLAAILKAADDVMEEIGE